MTGATDTVGGAWVSRPAPGDTADTWPRGEGVGLLLWSSDACEAGSIEEAFYAYTGTNVNDWRTSMDRPEGEGGIGGGARGVVGRAGGKA